MPGLPRDATELVAELEFVWNQIKHNAPSSSSSSPQAGGSASAARHFQQPLSGTQGPMKMLSPMSEDDEAELRSQQQAGHGDDVPADTDKGSSRWQKKVERAMTNLSAEIAALREQISAGREWRSKKERSFPAQFGWIAWLVMKHLVVDSIVLALILLWMRKRKDRRLEDVVRSALRIGREYMGNVLPSR